MVKIRITYIEDIEKNILLKSLEKNFKIVSVSKEYEGRGNSIYKSVYVELEVE